MLRSLLKEADPTARGSVSGRARKRRMEFFRKFLNGIGNNLSVADVGGTFYHWKDESDLLSKMNLTLINVEDEAGQLPENVKHLKADARDLGMIADKQFDIAYSNSMIEHFSNFEDQKLAAAGIRRIAKHFFVQTPNYRFPVEPHFLFPFFQNLPLSLKKELVMRFSLGWFVRQSDERSAEELVSSVRLLKFNEIRMLFPGAEIYTEKYMLLNKSFIAYC